MSRSLMLGPMVPPSRRRRGTGGLIRLRAAALPPLVVSVVGRRCTFLFALQVAASGFADEFRRLDKVLDGVTISDGNAA